MRRVGRLLGEPCIDARCRYEEIRNMCLKQLALNWKENSTAAATRASVNKQLDTFTKEAPEQAMEIVLALLQVADEDDRVRSHVVTQPSFVSSTGFAFSSA